MVVSQNTVVTGTRLGKERYRLCGFVAYTLGFYFNYYSICTFLTPYISLVASVQLKRRRYRSYQSQENKLDSCCIRLKKNNLVDCHSNNFSLRML
mgnify:FL=1